MTRTVTNRTLTRHRTDMVSLVAGAILLGVLGTWALERTNTLSGARGWLLPLLLIGVGIIGLIGVRPRRPTDEAADSRTTDWTDDEAPAHSVPPTDLEPPTEAEPPTDAEPPADDSTRP